jgi:hypothetical protein
VHSLRLAARRSGAQSGLLATVGAVALVLTALIVGLTGYLDFSATANTRAFVADAGPTASGLRVETKLGDNPEAQTAAAEALFARELDGIPMTVTRTLTDYPLPAALDGEQLRLPDGREARVTPSSDTDIASFATLVEGAWPSAASGDTISGALQADAAQRLGLHVGDVLALGTGATQRLVTIAGTWRANDSGGQRWFGDPGVATGNAVAAGDGTPSFGPLIVDESVLPEFGPDPFVHWVIAIDPHRVTPDDLETLRAVATSLRQDIIDEGTIGKGDILVEGTLAETVSTIQRGLGSVRGVTPIGILLAALIGLIALAQLARLLTLARRPEIALLRSRGASAAWLAVGGVVEALVVAGASCVLGFLAGVELLVLLFGAGAAALAEWLYAVAVGIAVVLLFGAAALREAVRISRRDTIDDSGRARAAATIGTAVLAVAAAAVAVWQSMLYGSPLVTSASGRTAVDPLIVVAPALALVAIALVLLVAFGPFALAWQRIAVRRPRLQPSYSARQVARGIGSYAVAVLVVTLAVGGLVLAAGYSGSWRTLGERAAEVTTGADARVDLPDSGFSLVTPTPLTGAEFRGVDRVDDATPVFSTALSIGDNDTARLTAVPATAIDSVVTRAGGAIDTKELDDLLGGYQQEGIALPAGTSSISLEASVLVTDQFSFDQPFATTGTATVTLWFQNEAGALASTSFTPIVLDSIAPGATEVVPLEFGLPAADGPWWLTAAELSTRAESGWIAVTLSGLTATTDSGTQEVAFDASSWGITTLNSTSSGWDPKPDSLTMNLPGNRMRDAEMRFMQVPGGDVAPGFLVGYGPDPIPVVVSTALADAYDLAVGDRLDLRYAGSGLTITSTVAGIMPTLPGIQTANLVFADLNRLNHYVLMGSPIVLRANQVWLATDGPVDLDNALPAGATVVTPATATDDSFAAPAELALWVAALGCLLLAAISLGAVVLTVVRARRGEVAVLRAVGLSARQQSRSRLGELTAVVLLSVVFGTLGGVAVAALTVANLARSAVLGIPGGLRAVLDFALVPGGILLGGALVVMLVIVGLSAHAVRRQALDTDTRIETR